MAYTTHGYHIPNTVKYTYQPAAMANCGGPQKCKQCMAEIEYHKKFGPREISSEENA